MRSYNVSQNISISNACPLNFATCRSKGNISGIRRPAACAQPDAVMGPSIVGAEVSQSAWDENLYNDQPNACGWPDLPPELSHPG